MRLPHRLLAGTAVSLLAVGLASAQTAADSDAVESRPAVRVVSPFSTDSPVGETRIEAAVSGYHAGQTSDLLAVLRERRRVSSLPIFVIGFSLGGNVALKLAGELAEAARALLTGVCAVSTPIDLAACVAPVPSASATHRRARARRPSGVPGCS